MRLDKYLTQSSIGTRKKVHRILSEGCICVNGIETKDATMQIDPNTDLVTCSGDKVEHIGSVCYMFHKPKGCITARSDSKEKTVLSYFSDLNTEGIFMIGRLDKDTEGLLLLTNDGELDHRLMDPESHIDKTYFFWAVGELTHEDVSLLENGLVIANLREQNRNITDQSAIPKKTKPAQLQIIKQGMYHEFADEIPIKLHEDHVVCGLLTISEGQKHQVKRMLRAVGCRIFQLKRISIGNLTLDPDLKPGEYRKLTEEEIKQI